MFLTILVCVGILVLIIYKIVLNSPQIEYLLLKHVKLPVLGNLWLLGEEPYKLFMRVKNDFGYKIPLQLGSYSAIVLTDPVDIRALLAKEECSGRGMFRGNRERGGGVPRGFIFSSGKTWSEQRDFVVKELRQLGFSKSSLELAIIREVDELGTVFKIAAGKAIFFHDKLNASVFNILWTAVASTRYSYPNSDVKNVIDCLSESVADSKFGAWGRYIDNFYNFKKAFPFLFRDTQRREKRNKFMKKFILDTIQQQKSNWKVGQAPGNFIESYLQKIENTKDSTSSFYMDEGFKNLSVTLMDLLLGGLETTSTALHWELLLLAMHPDVQERLYEEIKATLGLSTNPSVADWNRMPYTQCVIMEVLRYSSFAPLALSHRCTSNVVYKGEIIPKETLVIPNLFGVMHDPETFENPDLFQPERFLSQNGNTVLHPKSYLPFSAGRRSCPGTQLAQNQLFMFTTCLFQKFKVIGIPGNTLKNLKYTHSTVLVPKQQQLVFAERAKYIEK